MNTKAVSEVEKTQKWAQLRSRSQGRFCERVILETCPERWRSLPVRELEKRALQVKLCTSGYTVECGGGIICVQKK